MKYIVLSIMIALLCCNTTKADQMTSFTDEQADSMIKLLKPHKEIILYCGCCDGDTINVIHVSKFYKKRYTEATWEIWFIGKDKNGKRIKTFIDAAYTHLKVGENAVSCCTLMKFDCNPCTKPFPWKK